MGGQGMAQAAGRHRRRPSLGARTGLFSPTGTKAYKNDSRTSPFPVALQQPTCFIRYGVCILTLVSDSASYFY